MEENYEKFSLEIQKAQQGDKQAMEDLINSNKGLIWSIIRRFQDRGFEVDDLYQVAIMGFIKCIKKFDTSFEVKLSTYAVPYILGEVKRHVRDSGPVKISRSLKELAGKIIALKKEYIGQTGQEMKIEELAQKLKTPKEEIILALDVFNPVESIYESTYESDEDTISIVDKLSTGIDEQTAITNQLCIKQLLENLNEEEKQIILLRYYKGKTQTEVAKILGITQVRVSRTERKTLEHMKLKLAI